MKTDTTKELVEIFEDECLYPVEYPEEYNLTVDEKSLLKQLTGE